MFFNIKNAPSTLSDWEDFIIKYRNTRKTPVNISMQDNTIVITAHVKFASNMLYPYKSIDNSEDIISKKGPDYTFADAAIEGIKEYWEKEYKLPGYDKPQKLVVNFIRFDDPTANYEKGQRFFKIKLSRISDTSFVASSPWRWLWGIFFYLSPESVMLNWSPYAPGTIHMHRYKYLGTFKRTVAHEFGHILGIGDAYAAHYRFYYEAPNTSSYMMNSNISVNANELLMVLNAHKTHKMQYFPFKFSAKTYFSGAKSNFRYYYNSLMKSHKSKH